MKRGEGGFTLIELVIGLAVGAAAVLIAAAGVAAAITARAGTIAANALIEDIAAASTLQRRLLARAFPVRIESERERQQPAWLFEGDFQHVRFVSALWGDPGAAGLWEIVVSVQSAEARSLLTVQGRPYSAGDPESERQPETTLAETSTGQGAQFAYAERAPTGTLRWGEEWKEEQGWPAMVSFDPDGDGPAPPVLAPLPQPQAQQQPGPGQ